MELTNKQIQQIDAFLIEKKLDWFDVRLEITDHFAETIKAKIKENKTVTFEYALERTYLEYKDVKFKRLKKEKSKEANKEILNLSKEHFLTFFKVPKIILTVSLYILIYKLHALFNIEDSQSFFLGLDVIIAIITMYFLKKIAFNNRINGKGFLLLDSDNNRKMFLTNLLVFYNLIIVFTAKLHSEFWIHFKIFMFILFLLIAVSIYQINKKLIKKLSETYFKNV